jgi:hypothetical protein
MEQSEKEILGITKRFDGQVLSVYRCIPSNVGDIAFAIGRGRRI